MSRYPRVNAARRSGASWVSTAETRIGVGVDRLDYTKGIEHKFLAIERLLERKPSLSGRFVFVQLAEPSRECIRAYQLTRDACIETAARINSRFGAGDWQPIRLLEAHHSSATVARFLRAADVCYVGSLHDGMNLVGKEFVRERDDERGVLRAEHVRRRGAGADRRAVGESV